MATISISEATIRRGAGSPEVYTRGERYWKRGHAKNPAVREEGSILTADVEGSESAPYSVTIRFAPAGRVASGECDCPYGEQHDGWCKHIVAVLLLAANTPEKLKIVPALSETLGNLDGADLEMVLYHLAGHDPRLGDDIIAAVKAIRSAARR